MTHPQTPSHRRSSGADLTTEQQCSRALRRRSSDLLSVLSLRRYSDRVSSWFSDIFERFNQTDDIWCTEEDDEISIKKGKCWSAALIYFLSIKRLFVMTFQNPKILLYRLFTFIALTSAGLAVIITYSKYNQEEMRQDVLFKTTDMAYKISKELDFTILPLFILQEYVNQLPTFQQMPIDIAATEQYTSNGRSYRNVTGICDNLNYTEPYVEIASHIKEFIDMPGILVNIQLNPYGVVCLLHPLINSEDFQDGIVMDNHKAVGLDLLNDLINGYGARAAVQSQQVNIQGPLSLVQGDTPVVKEAFITRLAFGLEGYSIAINGVEIQFWGFTTILINWAALIEKVGFEEFMRSNGIEYAFVEFEYQ